MKSEKKSINDNDYTCNICLEPCTPVEKLLCGHFVHTHCIAQWASSNSRNSNSCPVCRITYKESRETDQLKNNASIKIQAHWRRYVKQKIFLDLRNASIKIQAHWRRYHIQILYIVYLLYNSIKKNQRLYKRTYGSARRYTRFRFHRDFEKMFKRNNYNSHKRILKKAGSPKHRSNYYQTSQKNNYYYTSNVEKNDINIKNKGKNKIYIENKIYIDKEIKTFYPTSEIIHFVFKKKKWQCFKPQMPISSR